jgi:hypothetical protein
MGLAIKSGSTGYKVSDTVWNSIVDLTVEAGRPLLQLRGLPQGAPLELPDGVVEDLDESLRLALEAGKPFPPGEDPVGVDDQFVLTRDTIHRVRHVLRLGKVRLEWVASWPTGEERLT